MKNEKFIIINQTKTYKDYELFQHIIKILEKGLISHNKTTYQTLYSNHSTINQLLIETLKTNYGYKIIARERGKWE